MTRNPADADPTPHVGCCRVLDGSGACPAAGTNDGGMEISYTGSRYAQVAAATGGVTVSICQQDFSGALASLGYAASGLRRDFRLSRGPDVRPDADAGVAAGLTAYVSAGGSLRVAYASWQSGYEGVLARQTHWAVLQVTSTTDPAAQVVKLV